MSEPQFTLIDSHTHLDGAEFDADRDEVLARARAAGVKAFLNVGTGDPHGGNLERAVALAEQHPDIYAAVGVHPHDAKLFDKHAAMRIGKLLATSKKVIAYGEIGLDYHYDHSPRDVQQDVFRRQVSIARAFSLPVIIHARSADEDLTALLDELYIDANESGRSGVMHCFVGGMNLMQAAVARGFYISFSGILTFKTAEDLRAVAHQVPLEKLLVETDCPYLAPIPHRGKRNEPAFVVETLKFLADLRGIETAEMARLTNANFARLFNLPALAENLTI